MSPAADPSCGQCGETRTEAAVHYRSPTPKRPITIDKERLGVGGRGWLRSVVMGRAMWDIVYLPVSCAGPSTTAYQRRERRRVVQGDETAVERGDRAPHSFHGVLRPLHFSGVVRLRVELSGVGCFDCGVAFWVRRGAWLESAHLGADLVVFGRAEESAVGHRLEHVQFGVDAGCRILRCRRTALERKRSRVPAWINVGGNGGCSRRRVVRGTVGEVVIAGVQRAHLGEALLEHAVDAEVRANESPDSVRSASGVSSTSAAGKGGPRRGPSASTRPRGCRPQIHPRR